MGSPQVKDIADGENDSTEQSTMDPDIPSNVQCMPEVKTSGQVDAMAKAAPADTAIPIDIDILNDAARSGVGSSGYRSSSTASQPFKIDAC
jgi:hypothetical protein